MMKNIYKVFFTLILLVFFSAGAQAVPAYPYPQKIIQPDGSEITIRLKGDEFFHYKTTVDGYLLTQDEDGILNYAGLDDKGRLVSTHIKANEINNRTAEEIKLLAKLPDQSTLSQTLSRKSSQRRALKRASQRENSIQKNNFPVAGRPKSLVVLVNFADVKYTTPDPRQAFSRMLNEEGYAENKGTGSARDYFKDSSTGVFEPEFVVVGPYDLPNNMEFYGGNDRQGEDEAPRQMVIDACRLADGDGVDFTEFDVDNDGFVDNVFIFYAGYNEAEYGPKNSVWPHRWTLADYQTRFDGKIIFDYACTSELRSNRGSEMCGIGTFVHEFGHVLGLPDYYITADGPDHHTLGEWNVMDSGSYLNNGRTPPAYSAYDRFYLNWLEPVELIHGRHVTLEPLPDSNKAYIFTETDNHNMNGANPDPAQFFILENRQKTGWDTYLPGHGMLITRINYNKTDWDNNTVNNNANKMGVEIIRADGQTTGRPSASVPFPGSLGISTYTPKLQSGVLLNKQLLSITEKDGIIDFDFLGSSDFMVPIAVHATDITSSGFTANWQETAQADYYYLSVYNITEGVSSLEYGFDDGLLNPVGWEIISKHTTSDGSLIGRNAPAVLLSESGEYILTEKFVLAPSRISFHAKTAAAAAQIKLEGWDEKKWTTIDNIALTGSSDGSHEYTLSERDNFVQFKISYNGNSGSTAVDDITVEFSKRLSFAIKDKYTTGTKEVIDNLLPDLDYYYIVRAARKENDIEIVGNMSNRIEVRTKEGGKTNHLRTYTVNGEIIAFIPDSYSDKPILVYSLAGRLVHRIDGLHNNFISIKNLPRNQIYIVKVYDIYSKVIIL